MRQFLTRIGAVLVIGMVTLAVSSCREAEQDRILKYEKGIYLGKADNALNADQLNTLADRTRLQSVY